MNFEVAGKIHEIFNTNQVSDRFKIREFVLEIQDGAYQQFIKFQLNQDKVDLIEPYRIGDEVKIIYNLNGKPYTDRNGVVQYYNKLVVWKVEGASAGSAQQSAAPSYSKPSISAPVPADDMNDLPF